MECKAVNSPPLFICRHIYYLGLCLLLVLTSCTSRFQDTKVTNMPVAVSKPGTQEVDLDVLYSAVTQKVHETLPEAYFQGLVFSARCQDLPRLQGKLVLIFAQVRAAILGQQVVRATASVDTAHQTTDISYRDVSDSYPSTSRQVFGGDRAIKAIVAIAHQHITRLPLSACDVTITQLDNSWDVRCGRLDDFAQKCRFKIVDGEIIDTPQQHISGSRF